LGVNLLFLVFKYVIYEDNIFQAVLVFLVILLVFSFLFTDLLGFYVFFEFSLIPIVLIILG
jgi:hypothetical protein